MLKRVGVHAVVAGVHHVVIHTREAECGICASDDLESFVAARRRDDCVGGRDRWDDVFDDALGHGICDAGYVEFVRAGEGFVVEPGDVVGVVCI